MKRTIRVKYEGDWTSPFNDDDETMMNALRGLRLEAVEVVERVEASEFEELAGRDDVFADLLSKMT